MLSIVSKCLVDKTSYTNLSTQFVDPYGSTVHTGACAPIRVWTTIHDKWTKLDLSNPTLSTCGFRNGGQNRFSICPPFTYIYLRKRKSGQKWTLFSYILFFFLFFLLYPLLPAIMLLPLFYKTPPFISDYAFFSLFWPLFYTFLHLFTSIQSRAIYPISKPQR